MKKSQLVKKHISTLEHFLEESGFPLRVAISEAQAKSANYLSPTEVADLCSQSSAFEVKDGMLSMTKKLDYQLLAAYWEFRFKEQTKEVNRLLNAAEKFRLEVGL
jgi:hypothetical protein